MKTIHCFFKLRHCQIPCWSAYFPISSPRLSRLLPFHNYQIDTLLSTQGDCHSRPSGTQPVIRGVRRRPFCTQRQWDGIAPWGGCVTTSGVVGHEWKFCVLFPSCARSSSQERSPSGSDGVATRWDPPPPITQGPGTVDAVSIRNKHLFGWLTRVAN